MLLPSGSKPQHGVEVADWPETRTKLMVEAAHRVIDLAAQNPAQQPFSEVRQRAALSSFCIPDVSEDDPLWDQRYSTRPRSRYYYNLLREECRTLELHARSRGCYLMLSPTADFGNRAPEATKVRLKILLEFLQSMPDDKVQVIFTPRAREGNLTILGDWVFSEAMVMRGGEGYRQPIFNWHAPTVMARLRSFDREFAELYRQTGLPPAASRQVAINEEAIAASTWTSFLTCATR